MSSTTLARRVIVAHRGEHHYAFVYSPEMSGEALSLPGRMVLDTNGDFSWQDAADVCESMRALNMANTVYLYSADPSERCACCGNQLDEGWSLYRDEKLVCRTCWEWGQVIDSQREQPRPSWCPVVMTVGCVGFWVAVVWVFFN